MNALHSFLKKYSNYMNHDQVLTIFLALKGDQWQWKTVQGVTVPVVRK